VLEFFKPSACRIVGRLSQTLMNLHILRQNLLTKFNHRRKNVLLESVFAVKNKKRKKIQSWG
jgi:hypothetical protein